MDKRNKRNDTTCKKIDNKAVGDLKKANDKIPKRNNTQVNNKVAFPDRGDSKISNNNKPEKMRLNILVKTPTNEEKVKSSTDNNVDKETAKKTIEKDDHDKDVQLRKRIRDKYTLKLKSISNKNISSFSSMVKKEEGLKPSVKNEENKNEIHADRQKKQMIEDSTQTKDKMNLSSTSSGKTEDIKQPERNPQQRKPMIKTIMSKNGSVRIYKAVTFVDDKPSLTPLEISIPGDSIKKQKASKFTDTNSLKYKTKATVSRVSIKEKPPAARKKIERKRDKRIRPVPPSSNVSVKDNNSPPTEVAKWAPSCIDNLTKPYYEAWVNTTLAAISKSSKRDRLYYEKQRENILKSFRRALEERPSSPELFYAKLADERYTGRIKITQR